MTQNANKEKPTGGQVVIMLLSYALVYYSIMTPLILLAWNVGLENAGIVSNQIAWTTALGLAVALNIIRGIFFRKP